MVSITGMYPRFVENKVRETLSAARVVLISGPRQSGKTTLAQKFTSDEMPYFSLDDDTTRKAALSDPVGFIRILDRAVIDEVHRVPELILAIKLSVDADTRTGRFLLTGSADFLKLPRLADSLAGRMSIIRLLPLSQSELKNSHSSFLSDVFAQKVPEPTKNLMIDHEAHRSSARRADILKPSPFRLDASDRTGIWTMSTRSFDGIFTTSHELISQMQCQD